ncbi:MAG: DUF5615 family PIN-like protein [candidate division KSB1 bacterium]|nr:DUF5615 family PIN-like protein [candidate division KSB1 bacterium]
MKFLLDVGISVKVAEFLEELGHQPIHLWNVGLETLRDADILSKARKENRVLLTHDLDFPDLVAASQAKLPSIIVFRLRDMRPEKVIAHLKGILKDYSHFLKKGAIITVTEGKLRVRTLPIGKPRK